MSKMIVTLAMIAAAIAVTPAANAAEKSKSQPGKAEQRAQVPKKQVQSNSQHVCSFGRERCAKNLFGLSGVALAEAPGKQAPFGNAKGSNGGTQFGPSKGSNAPQTQFGPGKGSNAPQTQFGHATGSSAAPKGYAVGNPPPPKGYPTGAPKGYPTGQAPAPSKDEKPQGYGTQQGAGHGQPETVPAHNSGNGGGNGSGAGKIVQKDIKG